MNVPSIQACSIPDDGLLNRYVGRGNFTDSYSTCVARAVSLEQFVTAFYSTPLFKIERWILAWAVARPSTDVDVRQLAAGASDSFAAWRVEARTGNELLMCDLYGNTRSWLMTVPQSDLGTKLYFGSAVVAKQDARTGQPALGFTFRALLGFHRLYSRALLSAARARVCAISPT